MAESIANNDSATLTAPGLAIADVRANDEPHDGALALASALPPELSFDTTTGAVTLLPGAEPGTYVFDYRLEDTATAVVSVTYTPPGSVECPCDTPYTPTPPPLPSVQACFPESHKWRVILPGFHILHDRTNTDSQCLSVKVERVVNCMKDCGIEEFSYCWPQGCPLSLLPPGTYDIYVPAQSAFPLEPGTEVEVTVMLEPVSDDYVAALNTITRGSSSCDC